MFWFFKSHCHSYEEAECTREIGKNYLTARQAKFVRKSIFFVCLSRPALRNSLFCVVRPLSVSLSSGCLPMFASACLYQVNLRNPQAFRSLSLLLPAFLFVLLGSAQTHCYLRHSPMNDHILVREDRCMSKSWAWGLSPWAQLLPFHRFKVKRMQVTQ